MVGRHVVAVMSVPFHEAKLTNVRTERGLGVRSTARDLRVVAALAQRWGPARARSVRAPALVRGAGATVPGRSSGQLRNTPRLLRPRH